MKSRLGLLMVLLFSLSGFAAAQGGTHVADSTGFQLSSTTFTNDATLPLSMINNITVNGINSCSINGSPGGNQSPEMSWSNAPRSTTSFVVVLYDDTAAFTHWGMYNISAARPGYPKMPVLLEVPTAVRFLMTFLSAPNMTAHARQQTSGLTSITTF
jgi:hypothetical protein